MAKSPTTLLTLALLLTTTLTVYLPELLMCASTIFLNKQITKYGPIVEKQLDTAKIGDISFDDKF